MQETEEERVPETRRPWFDAYGPGVDPVFTPLPDPDLGSLLRRAAAENGDRTAFTVCLENGMSGSLTFAEVDRLSDRFAAYLRFELGLSPGDRVALQSPNCLPFPVVAFGALKAGAILVNVNPLYTAPEMQRQLADSGARVLVIADLFADKLRPALEGTAVAHVVTLSIAHGLPLARRLLVQTVLRYVRRVVPTPPATAVPLTRALAIGRGHAGRLSAETRPRGPDDTALLQYTGGTTGVAKGAELTHGNLLANISQIFAVAAPAIRPREDVVLTALPMYHIFAFTFNLMVFYTAGCRNILCPSPRPPSNLRRAFRDYRITKFAAVNALFHGLLREPWFREAPPRTIDLSIAGGTALHTRVAAEWLEVVGSPVYEGYGLSETSPVVSVNPPGREPRPGTIGVPLPGTDVRLVDDAGHDCTDNGPGELAVRGPQVMRGYWQHPEETARALQDGWFFTGDVATLDADGFIRIVDRKKDMIDVSGFNVYPNEVEDCLAGHPDVDEVAVVGAPLPEGGERVRAFVVRATDALTEEALIQWARERLTGYKVPREVVFREELPKSPVGKILRRALRDA